MTCKILHLSDLHIDPARGEGQQSLLKSLVRAVRRESARGPIHLVAITGDIFDSASVSVPDAMRSFKRLLERLRKALGADAPFLVLPGNHDRRRSGVFCPHSAALFEALRQTLQGTDTEVFGCSTPFLAEFGASALASRLPFTLVAYDSTYLPQGWLSAGGMLRAEDLLQAAPRIASGPKDTPLVFLTHHHMVPTPVTDLSPIDLSRQGCVARWAVRKVLPRVVANADREELTMTALGAGTALTTLHGLQRAVLVLHGHKHYPIVRFVRSPYRGEGDVLLAAAGSAGLAEACRPSGLADEVRLWPSFNVVTLDGDELSIKVVAFSPTDARALPARRTLARATRRGERWGLRRVPEARAVRAPDLESNEAVYTLVPSKRWPDARWDMEAERTVCPSRSWDRQAYIEIVEGVHDGELATDGRVLAKKLPARLPLALDAVTKYQLSGGICQTRQAAEDKYEVGTAFEWVGLLNRYSSASAHLMLRGLPDPAAAFESVTDLTTGREQPYPVSVTSGVLSMMYQKCPARTLLCIHWPLGNGA